MTEHEIRRRLNLHTTATVVITYNSPGEEWMVRDDGYFYDDSTSLTFDIHKVEEAEAAVEEIQFASRLHQDALNAFRAAEVNTDSAEEMGTEPVNLDEHGELLPKQQEGDND